MHKIGHARLKAVNKYLMDEYNSDEVHHMYADWILKDVWMLWHVNDPAISTYLLAYIFCDTIYLQPGHKKKGLWLNEVFLKTLAALPFKVLSQYLPSVIQKAYAPLGQWDSVQKQWNDLLITHTTTYDLAGWAWVDTLEDTSH